jgi:predicted nucleotidyltransferase
MSLKNDIIKTIEYAKSYGCVLDKEQIYERLIGSTVYKLKPSVRQRRTSPLDKGEKLKKAKKLANILSKKFKNILLIGVTGSVASEFPKKNDDIDLFIIVKNNTLWINRFWVRFFVWRNKVPHRKFDKKEKRDEFCFNMWLDESVLKLPKNKQNLRNAVDMVLMKKVYDKNDTYFKFLKANSWAKKFVATPYYDLLFKFPSLRKLEAYPFDKRVIYFYCFLNIVYFLPQYWYLKLKKRKDLVNLHRAMWGKG